LAFASCGSSGSGGDDGPSGPIEPPEPPSGPTVVAPATVVAMTVMKHPYMPSFEGAYPDLTGLQVLVTWTDGTRDVVTDTKLFTVNPPIARLKGTAATAGTNTGYDEKNYKIQYIGEDAFYDLNSDVQVPLYIPAVIALSATAGTGTPGNNRNPYPRVKGNLGEVYEDEGVDASKLAFEGYYSETGWGSGTAGTAATEYYGLIGDGGPGGTAGSAAADANAVKSGYRNADEMIRKPASSGGTADTDFRWPTIGTSFTEGKLFSNPISSSPAAWDVIGRKPDGVNGPANYATYKVKGWDLPWTEPTSTPVTDDEKVAIDAFYRVDRLEYVSGIENMAPIPADDSRLGGMGNPNTDEGRAVLKAWLDTLNVAGIKLKVTYYLDGEAPETAKKEKPLTMREYIIAMSKTKGTANTPVATWPMLGGTPKQDPGLTPTVRSGVTDSVQRDYNLVVHLFYYDPTIGGPVGQGTPGSIPGITPNPAIIPITESNLIWTYRGLNKVRKDKTGHTGEPEIVTGKYGPYDRNQTGASGTSATTTAGTAALNGGQALYSGLDSYWDIVWEYESPSDRSAAPIQVKYPGRNNTTTWPVYKIYRWNGTGTFNRTTHSTDGWFIYDYSPAEEGTELRQCTIWLKEPPSTRAFRPSTSAATTPESPQTFDELEFDYYMKP